MLARIQETDLSVPYREGRPVLVLRADGGGKAVPDPLPPEGTRRPGGGHPRPERARGGPEVLLARRVRGQRRRPLPRLHHRRHGLPRVHAVRQGPGRRRAAALQGGEGRLRWPGPPTTATLFYTIDDLAKRPYRVYRHQLGGTGDALVYEESDELFRIFVGRTRSREYVLLAMRQPHHDGVRDTCTRRSRRTRSASWRRASTSTNTTSTTTATRSTSAPTTGDATSGW